MNAHIYVLIRMDMPGNSHQSVCVHKPEGTIYMNCETSEVNTANSIVTADFARDTFQRDRKREYYIY